MTRSVSRRDILASTALATGLSLVAARSAVALTVETADPETNRLYLSACGGKDTETHRRLVAEIEARLPGASRQAIEDAIAHTVCPVCGCPLVAASR